MKLGIVKRSGAALCMLALTTAALSGCWDRHELNDLAIAVGIGFDEDKGNQVRVTVQLVNPGEVASKRGGATYATPVTTLSISEATTLEALKSLTTISPRKISPSHLRVLVIGEALARKGIQTVLDGISRNHEFRSDFYLIVAKGTDAKQVLSILTSLEKIPANKLFQSLAMSEKTWAPTVTMQLDMLSSDLSNSSKDTVLTGIQVRGDQATGSTKKNVSRSEPYARLKYSGLALFKGDKLVDWMSEEESKGYNYIMDKVHTTAGHVECPQGGTVGRDVVRTKAKIKGKVINGVPKITVDLFLEEDISESTCSIDLTKPEILEQLERDGEKKLREIMTAAIRKAQKNKADIFGFGNAIEDTDPKAWLRLKPDWDQYFADLDVTVRPTLEIRRLGTTTNPIQIRSE
ncbi:Ger(x)C family spore germination protein [Paenibacillus sp. NPDC056579]|uniref:Ger(x)C family spore germination protein n=1 Tax=Paenibacillus sp. NPDC056579 TaxID=3345871 RepID=UPI0036CA55FE